MRALALFVSTLAVCGAASAQDARDFERGFPLLATYSPKQHLGGSQVFAAAQAGNGILYFGTLRGVMSYDGAWWRHTVLPNDSAVFALAARSGPEIAVGAFDEFGWVGPDAHGTLTYHSLVAQLPPSMRDLGDVRGVCAMQNGFLYVAESSVIAWSGGAPRVIGKLRNAPGPQNRCFTAGGVVYLTDADGLHRLDSTTMKIARAGFDAKTIDFVMPFDDRRVLVAVRGEGLQLLDGAQATPFAPEASRWLLTKTVTAGRRLHDGRFVIATRTDGLLLLEPAGAIEQRLDASAGLPVDVLADALEDREGSLWLAYHGPLVRIDLSTPVSTIDWRRGVRGAINAVIRDRDRMHIATSHGLYFARPDAPDFRLVEGVPAPAWSALRLEDGALLVGTGDGVFVVDRDHRVRRIEGTAGLVVYETEASKSDAARVWLGLKKGIATLRRTADGWRYDGVIPGTPENPRSLVERDDALWAGATFAGLTRLDLRGTTPRVTIFGGGETHVAEIGGRIIVVNPNGFSTAMRDGRLVPHPELTRVAGDAFLMAEDPRGSIWLNTRPPRFLAREANGRYAAEAVPLVSVDPASIHLLQADPDGVVWFGSREGLFRFESSGARPAAAQPAPKITRAALPNGAHVAAPLAHSFSRLRVEFAPVSFRPGVTYQYRLDPADETWSAWTPEPFIDYTRLEPGDYRFRLRARSAWGNISEETSWSLQVLPPWYRTRWAMLLWILAAALLVAAIVRMRTTALRVQAARLRKLVEERTDELQQANAQLERLSLLDELTGIANRRYFQRALADDWRSAMEQRKPLAMVLLDVDHFKKLNDERGHLEGDAALVQVGRFLARELRRSGELPVRITDIVARIGGEEFAVLLSNTTTEEAMRMAERLRAGIESLPIGITVSCGVASLIPTDPEAWNTLVDRADRALYAAKAAGRNRVRADDEAAEELAV